MATRDELQGAALVYELFRKYATPVPGDTSRTALAVAYPRMKELMVDMGLLEGVPAGLADAFVREHMQRADQEGNELIGSQDFLVWLLTEVAALLPVRNAFDRVTGLRPLYNQFHAVMLGDVGFSDGARRPAMGMQAWQFLRLAEEYGLCDSSETIRHAFKAARASVGAFRGSSGSNTGAPMAEPSGGGRLQFAAFVRAIAMLAAHKATSLEAALYRVVSCGAPAPALSSGNDPRVTAGLTSLGLSSQVEGSCSPEVYRCGSCGAQHTRWRLDNWIKLEELLLSLGMPQPVRRYLPHLHLVNARNLRAVFHRYNAMYNRGKMPPTTYRLPGSKSGGSAGADGCGGGCCSQPAAYGACCCLYRSLSVMEMSSWLRLCGDCDTIRALSATHGSGLTPSSLEASFVQAASIAGVYLPDDSTGIHDVPIPEEDGGNKLSLQRNRLGAVVGSGTRAAASSENPPKRSNAAYASAPPPDPNGRNNAPRLHEVVGPMSATAWLASARSLPYGGGGRAVAAAGDSGPSKSGQQHRACRLALTFPQFMEALRLVAEEAGGHPIRTAASERVLLRVVHDIVAAGCPRPDPTTVAGTSQIRKQQHQRNHIAGSEAAAIGTAVDEAAAASAVHRALRSVATTSTTTSTKYSYDDFTPPESNLYTSATSSRIGSQSGRAVPERPRGAVPPAGSLSAATSATTSTKYTYDDFTPPDSNLYTSATSSRIGSRPSSASQPWKPQPVRSYGNTSPGASLVTNANGKHDAAAAVPSALQPKQRDAGGGGGGGGGGIPRPSGAAAAGLPPPPSALMMNMPLPPSARLRPPVAHPAAPAPPEASGTKPGSGHSAALQPPLSGRTRPSSAPRMRQQPRGGSSADGVPSHDGRAAGSGASRSIVATAEDPVPSASQPAAAVAPAAAARLTSAPRSHPNAAVATPPAGGREWVNPSGGYYSSVASAVPRARPSSAPRVRPSSAHVGTGGGSGRQTLGDLGSGRHGFEPPPVLPMPAAAWRSAWEPAGGASGARGSSGSHPSSAPRGRGGAAAADRPTGVTRATSGSAGAVVTGGGDGRGVVGFARPISPEDHDDYPAGAVKQRAGPAAAMARAAAAPPAASRKTGAPSSNPKPPAASSSRARDGTSANKPPAGIGFVSPLFTEPYIPGGSNSASAKAAAAKAEARPSGPPLPPPPPLSLPYKSPNDYVAATVAATSATVVHTSGGESSPSSQPLLRGGSGLRNTMLLLAADSLSKPAEAAAAGRTAATAGPGIGHDGLPPPPPPPLMPPPPLTQDDLRIMAHRWSGPSGTGGGDSAGTGSRRASWDSHKSSGAPNHGGGGSGVATQSSWRAGDGDPVGVAHGAWGGGDAARGTPGLGGHGLPPGARGLHTGNKGGGAAPGGAERPPLPYGTVPDKASERPGLELEVVGEGDEPPPRGLSRGASSASGAAGAAGMGGGGSVGSRGGSISGGAIGVGVAAGGRSPSGGMGSRSDGRGSDAEEAEPEEREVARWGPGDFENNDDDDGVYGRPGDPAAPSPRAVLAAAAGSYGAPSRLGARDRPPAEGTVNGLPQYFFT